MIVPFGLFRAVQLERRWLRGVRPGYAGGGWFASASAVVGVCGSARAVSVESPGEEDTSSGRAFSSAGDGGRDYEQDLSWNIATYGLTHLDYDSRV